MLKRISARDVSLGMYVHAMDGSWLAHPFWRSRFLLTRPEDVETLRRSDVSTVVIDLARSAVPRSSIAPLKAPRETADPFSAERRLDDLAFAQGVTDDARRFMKKVFDDVRDGAVPVPGELDTVIQSIERALDRNRSALLSVMRLKTRDSYTYFHSVAVGTLMINFARELGLPGDQVRLMGLGGLFHDIGKTHVSQAILNKPGRLTEGEMDQIRRHPAIGHEILLAGDVASMACDICLHHHERIDGRGYPFGLAGDAISLAARMGAICDVYDALTSERSYKDASSPVAALGAMAGWQGHLDAELLFVFMKSIGVFPVGMLIRLRTGHLAIVRDNGRRASRGRLSIFYALESRRFIAPYEIFLSDTNARESIIDAPDPAAVGLDDWPELRRQLLSGVDPSVGADT